MAEDNTHKIRSGYRVIGHNTAENIRNSLQRARKLDELGGKYES